jgi:transposase
VDLLTELGHELWVGDAAQIRASYVRQQKTDQQDAEHILKVLVEGRFPRIWMPSSEVFLPETSSALVELHLRALVSSLPK